MKVIEAQRPRVNNRRSVGLRGKLLKGEFAEALRTSRILKVGPVLNKCRTVI